MGITLPNQIIYGVAYNTQSFGAVPLEVGGPYISLNVGLNNSGGPAPFGPPSVGSNPGDPDVAYQNFNSGGFNLTTVLAGDPRQRCVGFVHAGLQRELERSERLDDHQHGVGGFVDQRLRPGQQQRDVDGDEQCLG
jgi:hypothetical protein